MYNGCLKMNFKFQKNIKFKIFNVSMMKLSKLILNFRKKLKIFNICMMDVLKLC